MNRGSTKSLSMTPPVLTGESRIDWALWQLSSILVEIAEHSSRRKDDNGASAEKQTRQKMNNGKVFLPTEDVSDV